MPHTSVGKSTPFWLEYSTSKVQALKNQSSTVRYKYTDFFRLESSTSKSTSTYCFQTKKYTKSKRSPCHDLPLNLPFMDVRHYIYQPDATKRVPNEPALSSLTVREKWRTLHNRLMINGLDGKFWYEPPFDWLQHFRVT